MSHTHRQPTLKEKSQRVRDEDFPIDTGISVHVDASGVDLESRVSGIVHFRTNLLLLDWTLGANAVVLTNLDRRRQVVIQRVPSFDAATRASVQPGVEGWQRGATANTGGVIHGAN